MLNDGIASALQGCYVHDNVCSGVQWPRQGEAKARNVPPAATAAAPLPSLMKIQRDAHHLAVIRNPA